ncbi:MAG: hypothetical protein IKH13_05235, partial [Clostridia bacterium]|nr:hypothetical protein [Clostridia bacterium]
EAGIDCLFEDGSVENEMTPDEAEARLRSADLQELEHKRWSAFMIMSGWDSWKLYSDDNYLSIEKYNKNKHKLPIAKLHGCLVNNNKLDEISTVVPATGEGDALRNNDRVVVNASAKALKSVYDNVRFINNPQER